MDRKLPRPFRKSPFALACALLAGVATFAHAQPGPDIELRPNPNPRRFEPRVIQAGIGEQDFVHAERTEDGQWFLLLRPETRLSRLLISSKLTEKMYVLSTRNEFGEFIGLTIHQIEPGSFVAEIGLQTRDVLLRINDTPLVTAESFMQFATQNPRAREMNITYLRGEDEHTIRVRLFYMPAETALDHEIAAGESLDQIAEDYYGHAAFKRIIRRDNGIEPNTDLPPGTRLLIPPHPALRRPAKETDAGTWMIPHLESRAVIDNFSLLVRQVRPTPVEATLADGETAQGLRLVGLNPRALPFKRGFQRGDIVTHINGVPMRSGADLLNFFNTHQENRFLEVKFLRGDPPVALSRVFCILPSANVAPADLLPPPTVAMPADFGCRPAPELARETANEFADRVIAWDITRAQTRFLSHHFREILDDVHLVPVFAATDGPHAEAPFAGVQLRYADADTITHAYGFRAGDVLTAVRIDGGEWRPVRAGFDLVRHFPIGLSATHIDIRFRRDGADWLFRAHLVATPEGIDELELFDPRNAEKIGPANGSENGNDNGNERPPERGDNRGNDGPARGD